MVLCLISILQHYRRNVRVKDKCNSAGFDTVTFKGKNTKVKGITLKMHDFLPNKCGSCKMCISLRVTYVHIYEYKNIITFVTLTRSMSDYIIG